tara:strand:+ start:353 stop:589 length:237 start_codon:yes stop_codon:yes gene_type:complete
MTSKNDITGDEIKTKGSSSSYVDNWTIIFERCAECNTQTKGESVDVQSIATGKTDKLCQPCYDLLTKTPPLSREDFIE